MAGTQPTLTNDGSIPAAWTAVGQALQATSAIASATVLQTNQILLDQYQNVVMIIGSLNQVVTAGAGWDAALTPPAQGNAIPGVQIGTGRTDFGIGVPSAVPVFTTITTTEGSDTATVASASGLSDGMQIGATDWVWDTSDPSGNTYEPAINPGTAIIAIDGTTITLSDPALISGAGLYCVAMATWDNLVSYFTANVIS